MSLEKVLAYERRSPKGYEELVHEHDAFYHGSAWQFSPGDVLTGPHALEAGGRFGDRVFMTQSKRYASFMARNHARARPGSAPHVYEVEPVGPVTPETHRVGFSAPRMRVVREVAPEYPLGAQL